MASKRKSDKRIKNRIKKKQKLIEERKKERQRAILNILFQVTLFVISIIYSTIVQG